MRRGFGLGQMMPTWVSEKLANDVVSPQTIQNHLELEATVSFMFFKSQRDTKAHPTESMLSPELVSVCPFRRCLLACLKEMGTRLQTRKTAIVGQDLS